MYVPGLARMVSTFVGLLSNGMVESIHMRVLAMGFQCFMTSMVPQQSLYETHIESPLLQMYFHSGDHILFRMYIKL